MENFLKRIPNFLSILRIIMVIPLLYYVKRNALEGILAFCILILLSDYFDGFLARRWKATTITGKVLDPVADKICIAAVGIALITMRDFPLALLAALILRDILILGASLYIIRKSKEVLASNIVGKLTVGVTSISLAVFLFDIGYLKTPAVILTSIMITVSIISYGIRLRLYMTTGLPGKK